MNEIWCFHSSGNCDIGILGYDTIWFHKWFKGNGEKTAVSKPRRLQPQLSSSNTKSFLLTLSRLFPAKLIPTSYKLIWSKNFGKGTRDNLISKNIQFLLTAVSIPKLPEKKMSQKVKSEDITLSM
jgi:hypothetical protein